MPRGRPTKSINYERVVSLADSGISKARIARIISVSRPTLDAYIQRNDLQLKFSRSNLTESEIDEVTRKALKELPSFGQCMTMGYFRASGIRIRRFEVRASIHRVDPEGVRARREAANRRIRRRVYTSPYPHYIWHIDGNHKLIRWGLVIHIGIDGFSRACVFMRCSDNNRAVTVLESFGQAMADFQVSPTRVRSDHGGENTLVWQAMLQHRSDENPNPVVVGASVHNQRVERFNREVNRHIRDKYATIFYKLEEENSLDVGDEVEMFCLHFVYLPLINRSLDILKLSHNEHAISTEANQTPSQLISANWHLRQPALNHPAVQGQTISDLNDAPQVNSVIVSSLPNPLDEDSFIELCELVDTTALVHADEAEGAYLATRYFVRAHL